MTVDFELPDRESKWSNPSIQKRWTFIRYRIKYFPWQKKMQLTCTAWVVGVLETNKGWSAFSSANNWQGQLQTPQSITVY